MTTKDDSQKPSAPASKRNISFVNDYRSSLTALVILHHAATSYGGEGSNAYQSSSHQIGSSAALVGFNAVNQSFFMSAFMYLAGHFSWRALQRKPTDSFVRDRIYRLGLPSVAYTLLAFPSCIAIDRLMSKGQSVDFAWLLGYWKGVRGVRGPVWFTATLLAFDLFLAAFWATRDIQGPPKVQPDPDAKEKQPAPRNVNPLRMYATLSLCSLSDFFLRTVYPVGAYIPPLGIQPAYVTQYIAAYIHGACADDVLNAIPSRATANSLRVIAIGSSFMLLRALQSGPEGIAQMKGGWTYSAASYALWNNVVGYLIGTSALRAHARLSRAMSGENGVIRALTRPLDEFGGVNGLAYSAFLLHMPVLTTIGAATDKWQAGPIQKTVLVGVAAVVGSWVAAYAMNKAWQLFGRIGSKLFHNNKREND